MHLGNGVIVGTCWWRIGYSQADLFPRISAIIIVYLFWTFFPLLSAPAIVDEGSVIKLLRKDYAAGAFRLSAWWWATTTVPLLREFIWPAIHVPIFYWMARARCSSSTCSSSTLSASCSRCSRQSLR